MNVSYKRHLWPRASSLIKKETLQFGISCFWIVGAVFNRDYPFNRGWKPLPPTINYSLNDIELNVVSYKRRRWPRASSLIGKETLMLFVQPQRRQGTKIKIHIIPLCLRALVAQL